MSPSGSFVRRKEIGVDKDKNLNKYVINEIICRNSFVSYFFRGVHLCGNPARYGTIFVDRIRIGYQIEKYTRYTFKVFSLAEIWRIHFSAGYM